jgi:hypothetical protein
VDTLARSAALAYAYAGHANEAHETLGSLAQNGRDEPMAQWARQWQGRLEAGVTRGDILAEMRRLPEHDASFKEWTLDKKSAMQKVERGYCHGGCGTHHPGPAAARECRAAAEQSA